jgi:two-component system cell cycle response regulator
VSQLVALLSAGGPATELATTLRDAGFDVVAATPDTLPADATVVVSDGEVPVGAFVLFVTDDPKTAPSGVHDIIRTPVDPVEAVLRVRAAARTAALAFTDQLTGVFNRHALEDHLARFGAAARRQRKTLSLVLVDVDQLRRINERLGRPAGDAVLRAVADRISANLRTEDVTGRWGSEEFLAVLPTTELDGAWTLGDRIRLSVSDEPLAIPGGADEQVTVSVGCAVGWGDDVDDHVRRVEDALAEAKATGRNRVVADTSVAG